MHTVVIGGGIVGLATARALRERGHVVTLCEKETGWARHQTGRNSGVIHSGLYYRPGSLKARLCVAGAASTARYAEQHNVPYAITGKLVVATGTRQLAALAELERRGVANGVPVTRLAPAEAKDHEPAVTCVAALRVESTGIVDFGRLAATIADELTAGGSELRLGTEVVGIRPRAGGVTVETTTGDVAADALVNCAGLHSDRIAELAGLTPGVRIVPFRGEYHEVHGAVAERIRGLVYPVPNPAFPFLGVHLTRGIDGSVHAGPNAVLAMRREGYRWGDVSARDLRQTLTFPGFWRIAGRHARTGAGEVHRSLSRRAFATELSKLAPGITATDLAPSPAGVRAQAVTPQGVLLDDFAIQTAPRQVHVLNAPSPAATSAFEIGNRIAAQVEQVI